jgi:hypothetical protein
MRRRVWMMTLYLGVLGGVLATYIREGVSGDIALANIISFKVVFSSVVTTMLIYPYVYKTANFDKEKPNFMQVFVSFTYGYFWDKVINSASAIF